jgi:hypothetical protein
MRALVVAKTSREEELTKKKRVRGMCSRVKKAPVWGIRSYRAMLRVLHIFKSAGKKPIQRCAK